MRCEAKVTRMSLCVSRRVHAAQLLLLLVVAVMLLLVIMQIAGMSMTTMLVTIMRLTLMMDMIWSRDEGPGTVDHW